MYEELIERLRVSNDPQRCILRGNDTLNAEAADAIEHLCEVCATVHNELANVLEELEQVKRERDAAVEHLKNHAGIVSRCWICKNKGGEHCPGCVGTDLWSENDYWEWRGVKEG